MLLERLRSRVPPVTTRNGGGPCKGGKPASEGTGQAEACLTRPAINARENSRHKKSACSRLWRYRASNTRVTTPGHGIDRDGADCNAGEGRGQGVEVQACRAYSRSSTPMEGLAGLADCSLTLLSPPYALGLTLEHREEASLGFELDRVFDVDLARFTPCSA